MVAWARASFEQGALPSLLFLQGIAPIFTLPGEKMFQATGLSPNKLGPPVMHAYGGAKVGMSQALQSIASEGWIPFAAAMVGTADKQPMWADLGLRPVVGTTVDMKVQPSPIGHKEFALILSCWKRWDVESIPNSAINSWLKGVNTAMGPDCEDSPHFKRSNLDCMEAMRLLSECGFEFLPSPDLQRQPIMETVMTVGLQLCALEYTEKQLDILSYLSLTGSLPVTFPHEQWVTAVQKSYSTQVVAACSTRGQWDELQRILQAVRASTVAVESADGTTIWTKDSAAFPSVQDHEFPLRVLVHPSIQNQSHMPDVVRIEATGLGGKDLGSPDDWDISVRTDTDGQNVYGPSLATVEDHVSVSDDSGGLKTKHVIALGLSKAIHEFLTLHYFALDSADWWEKILDSR